MYSVFKNGICEKSNEEKDCVESFKNSLNYLLHYQ